MSLLSRRILTLRPWYVAMGIINGFHLYYSDYFNSVIVIIGVNQIIQPPLVKNYDILHTPIAELYQFSILFH